MSLPSFSVKRPVLTVMVTMIIVVLGAVSFSKLRIDLLPDIELPTLTVRTGYEGASPLVMERMVTQIVEEIVATVPGVEEMTSISSEGNSSVRVKFSWGRDIDTAAVDIQSTLEDEINELPDDIVKPRVAKYDVNSYPVIVLGISSDLDPVKLTELIEDQIRRRFARVPGVAQVDTWGAFYREIRIEVDPERLNALGLPINLVLNSIRDANLDLPAGKIEEGIYEITLRAPSEYLDLDEIKNTVIMESGGAAVRIGQIADVTDTFKKQTRIVRVDGKRGLRAGIRKQFNANTVEVSKGILKEIEDANKAFPQVRITAVTNQGNFIERSIANVTQSVVYGGALAVLVLLFFLRSLGSTIIIALAIPISVVATFALLYSGGFTLNLMTLGGLALGVGMMVDNSIVALENIFRRKSELGEEPVIAAVKGAEEIAPAITASTITSLVIFLPLVFTQGVSGALFKELAYVIAFSLFCSLFVSLSIVPMLSSRLLGDGKKAEGMTGRFSGAAGRIFASVENRYSVFLSQILQHRWTTVLVSASLLAASLTLIPHIGTEFLPPSDEGEVRVSGKMEIGTKLDLVNSQTKILEKLIFESTPEMMSAVSFTGASGWNPTQAARGSVNLSLSPASERDRSNTMIAGDLRKKLAGKIPGMEISTRAPQGQFLLERILGTTEGLTVEISGFDLDILNSLAKSAAEAVKKVPGVTDVEYNEDSGIPQQEVRINRDKAASLGISVRDITEALETSIAGTKAGEFRSGGDSYRIFVQLKDAEKRSLNEILNLTVNTGDGSVVALRNLVSTEPSRSPVVISRKDQQRIVTLEANFAGRDMGAVAEDVKASLDMIPRPAEYDLALSGAYEEQQKAFQELVISLLLAIVLVYMVLASLYESVTTPLVVMVSVPLAVIGVVLILFLTNTTFNVQSYIGCIILGGIVVNNAILLVDQAGRLESEGMKLESALAEAGRRRLRPILMTTFTTILALVPLAFGVGEGADAQAPLARAVVGGLAGSTLITLALAPAVYSIIRPGYRASSGVGGAK